MPLSTKPPNNVGKSATIWSESSGGTVQGRALDRQAVAATVVLTLVLGRLTARSGARKTKSVLFRLPRTTARTRGDTQNDNESATHTVVFTCSVWTPN